MGWFVGDNVTVNDVAVRYVCRTVDPSAQVYDPLEMRGRYAVSYFPQTCLMVFKVHRTCYSSHGWTFHHRIANPSPHEDQTSNSPVSSRGKRTKA